jgi:hypothetical protein
MLGSLTAFQVIALAGTALVLVGTVVALVRRRLGWREGLFWLLVLIAGTVAVIWPESTSWVAQGLGIGRGADLILYIAVIVMVVGFWMMYLRLRQLRREVTLMVRHIALTEAEGEAAARGTTVRAADEANDKKPG